MIATVRTVVVCAALTHVPARVIRNKVDMTFYMDDSERVRNAVAVRYAVEAAFRFVAGRVATGTRG